jgi:hypothetical protein
MTPCLIAQRIYIFAAMEGSHSIPNKPILLIFNHSLISRQCRLLKIALAGFLFLACCLAAMAQTNSWTGSVSGYWENLDWSLGILPATNQNILFTNAGWKALAIGPNTAQNFPQTLTVESLTISSPTNSANELLMNYSGLQVPLLIGNSAGSLVIKSNSLFVMLSSALEVQNSAMPPQEYGAFSIGGTFTESFGSQVSANFMHLGDIGPGIYNLTNSTLSVGDYEIVGGFAAVFNQNGGTNSTSTLILTNSGEYDLYSGNFEGQIELQGGLFNQWGGNVSGTLLIPFLASYRLSGGILSSGDLTIPDMNLQGPPSSRMTGSLLQTGGTNFADNIELGNSLGIGGYTLSNGVLSATSLTVGTYQGINPGDFGASTFVQSGGFHTNGTVTIQGAAAYDYNIVSASYSLSGGSLATAAINVEMGVLKQSGGSNQVGTLALNTGATCDLSGGWLIAQNIQLNGLLWYGEVGGFVQSGGTNQVGDLSLYQGEIYTLSGGQLVAQQLQVTEGATFQHTAGKCSLAGILTLAGGIWQEQTSSQQFGQLQLGSGSNVMFLPSTSACVLQFTNSSSLTWSNGAVLMIYNWNGSLSGGGHHRIIFGNNALALAPQQLAQIQFYNPAGLALGTYPARILANGEIVPNAGVPVLGLSAWTGRGSQLTLLGQAGKTYEIEVSSNLVSWTQWTNQSSGSGTISITDNDATNHHARFYRAILLP